MNLSQIIKEHTRAQAQKSISKNLGDAYLLKHNRIFRKIREATLKAGFKFSPNRIHDYDVLPLSQLPVILRRKTIPYVDNVRPLIEIEKQAKNAFRWSEVPPLKANYLMHESAHAIARALRNKAFGEIRNPKNKTQKQELILRTLVEEAFANTCECLSNLESLNEIHDEFLYKNSYIMEKPRDRATLRTVKKQIGEVALFKLILFAYLYANFLKTKPTQTEFNRALKVILPGLSPDQKPLRSAFQIGLNLDPAFTIFTSSFCFRLMGIKGNVYEFLNFDFMKLIEKDPRYLDWLHDLTAVIVEN